MQVRIPRNEFSRLLQAVQGVVERKSTMRILECVLLEADAQGVEVVATDLDVGVRHRGEAEVQEAGAVCLPARKLIEIVRLLPEEIISLRVKESNRTELRCGASVFNIVGLAREEFPSLPSVEEAEKLSIPRAAMGEMIDCVDFAITNDDSRYALNGCLMTLQEEIVRLVASDGHRLAFVERKVEGLGAGEKAIEVIVPKKALGELGRLCADEKVELIEFARKENQVLFRCGARVLISRLLEGQFPNYDRVIPKENVNQFEVETVQLGSALRRVALLASEHSRSVRMALGPGKVEVSASTPEQGEARETIEVEYGGPEVHIAFNVRYLLDFVAAVSTEKVRVALRDKDTQGLLSPIGNEHQDYRYVIMPMRLEEPAESVTS
ncbi:MAG: DNA polymerase III subunit beta [Acidobacteriota bacterium]